MITLIKNVDVRLTRLSLLLAIFLNFWNISISQSPSLHIKTKSYMDKMMANDETIAANQQLLETDIQGFTADNIPEGMQSIGMIFHVVHHTPEQEVPAEKIANMLDKINEIYGNTELPIDHQAMESEAFSSVRVSMDFQFCIAPNYPIQYIQSPTANFELTNQVKQTAQGGSSGIQTEHYINVWIAPMDSDIAGFAQMPGGPILSDGIVMNYQLFDDIDGYGSTVFAHLIGNYFGLYPLWGFCDCCDDLIEDTPIHNGPNYKCYAHKHGSTCESGKSEMVMNVMDVTADKCDGTLITQGQKTRIWAVLSSNYGRPDILNSSSCY